MGNLVLNEFSTTDLDALNYPDATTKAIVRLVFSLMKYGAEKGVKFWDENGDFMAEKIIDWVYPIFSNDSVMEYAADALETMIGKDNLTEEDKKMLELLPKHAFLTKKMPSGSYIMFESSVPDGYIHSPLFYSIEMTWNTEDPYPAHWCYVSVADLGIILPYCASDYYSYLRNLNVPAEADRILNLITDGKTGNLIYDSEEDLAKDLTKYLYTYGRTAQNMMMFGHEIASAARSVVTDQITKD